MSESCGNGGSIGVPATDNMVARRALLYKVGACVGPIWFLYLHDRITDSTSVDFELGPRTTRDFIHECNYGWIGARCWTYR